MAQVTMSGHEYETLLKGTARLGSVEKWLIELSTFEFPSDEFNSWGIGKAPSVEDIRIPEWVEDLMVYCATKSLLTLDNAKFREVVEERAHYYTPFSTHLTTYGGIDLLKRDPDLKARWDMVQEGEDE